MKKTDLMIQWRFWLAALSLSFLALAACVSGPYLKARFSPEPAGLDAHYDNMVAFHSRGDAALPAGRIILLGDSLVQGLPAAAISDLAVNYGIGGDTTVGLLQRLPQYQSLDTALAIFLAIGINDLLIDDDLKIEDRYQAVLDRLPEGVPIFCSAALPIDSTIDRDWQGRTNERNQDWNQRLKKLCTEHGATYLPTPEALMSQSGLLQKDMHAGDGLHLNAKGNAIWAAWIKSAINDQLE